MLYAKGVGDASLGLLPQGGYPRIPDQTPLNRNAVPQVRTSRKPTPQWPSLPEPLCGSKRESAADLG
jgi:hypothetical protein